jgi:hypothetical protein
MASPRLAQLVEVLVEAMRAQGMGLLSSGSYAFSRRELLKDDKERSYKKVKPVSLGKHDVGREMEGSAGNLKAFLACRVPCWGARSREAVGLNASPQGS